MDEKQMAEEGMGADYSNYYPDSSERSYESPSPVQAQLLTLPTIDSLRNELLGGYFNEDTNKWVQDGEAMLNKKGFSRYMSIVKTYVNPTIIQANFLEHEIQSKMLSLGKALTLDIAKNQRSYEIKNPVILKRALFDFCHAALSRSKDGFLAKLLTKQFIVKEQQTFVDTQQKRPFGDVGKRIFGR